MKRKRTISLNSSSITTRSKTRAAAAAAAAKFYLPDDCWESVFKFVINDKSKFKNRRYLNSLSLVSKQFLSITNSLNLSLTIYNGSRPFLRRLFQRFTNLTSLDLTWYDRDLNKLLCQISRFPLNLTTLTSLTCSRVDSLRSGDMCLIADCFPNLQLLDLSYCSYVSEEGILQVLRRCCKLRHLNLANCSKIELHGMNFEVPNLEVLNLSRTSVDDETLYMISQSCRGLLQLLLRSCYVTERGVNYVIENCTQLREINLRGCCKVHASFVASMLLSRPSLREIIVPSLRHFSVTEREFFKRHICLVY
ncbi:putative leucine-rich repeat domain, L domain-containing protein [Medicago truncatula]|uniref:F-box/LRR protein n=1 Tax=Medicago truncatula TaxID=3880 RepID=A0A072UGR4_MEDTR|nr:F-box/LRR-repeat protein 2 [Medicago truncatula]KEH28631.1 F-box/LRR protein [Medicago truncatula]RHN58440.1 putative leucine-rich repeat domain, L domain-containing protein [Medicago truncatula]